MKKQIKMNNSLITISLILALSSCALTGDKLVLREPAQVSDAQKFQAPNLKADVDKSELIWLDIKTPAKDIVFADAKREALYKAFLKTFALEDTLEIRNRFAILPIKPFSSAEMNYLENIPYYKSQVAAMKAKKAKATAVLAKRKNIFNRSQQKVVVDAKTAPSVAARVRVSQGKPSYVEVTQWIASDVAQVLQNQGIYFEDTVLYFKTFGFRSLVTGKKLHISDLYLRYKEYGSTGNDYVDLTQAEIERIKKFSSIVVDERAKILVDLIKNGESVEQYQSVLLANGYSMEQIQQAMDTNNPVYQQAYQQGTQYNALVTKYAGSQALTLAALQAKKEMGYITEADYNASYTEEKAAVDKYTSETRNGWSAGIANVVTNVIDVTKTNAINSVSLASSLATVQSGGIWIAPTMIDPKWTENRDAYAKQSLDEKIKTYGSLVKYYRFLQDVEKKYQFRPLARPLEAATNFYKAIPTSVTSVISYVDVLREISPVPITPLDMYYKIVGQPFKATDGNLSRAAAAINTFVEDLKPANNDFREEFSVTVAPKVIGQLTVQLGAGWLSGGALVPTMMGVALGGREAYDTAVKAGATDDQRRFVATIGSFTGILDAIPMGKFLAPLKGGQKSLFVKGLFGSIFNSVKNKAGTEAALAVTRASIARQIMVNGGKILGGIVTEGATELGQKKINDFAAKLSYDPKRNVLFINEQDMQEFYGGAFGGAFGGVFQIALESKNPTLDNAIENQIGQVTGIFPMMKAGSLPGATSNSASLQTAIMNYEAQIKTNEASPRTDKAFLDYKKSIIEKQTELMRRAMEDKTITAELRQFINQKVVINQQALTQVAAGTTSKTSTTTEVDSRLDQEAMSPNVVSTLKKLENRIIYESMQKNSDYVDAFVEVMKGDAGVQKNFIEYLVPKETIRRTFFNQMMQKIIDSKIFFTRREMIDRTKKVLNEPGCKF